MVHLNLFTFVTYTSWIFKLPEPLPKILSSNSCNTKSLLLPIVWPFGTEIQTGYQTLTWYSHRIILLWRWDFPIFHTINLRIVVRKHLFLTILDIPVFPNIAPFTTCHVHRSNIFLTECLPCGSTTIKGWWCCYNF